MQPGAALPARWWALYQDPMLDGLIEQALRDNIELKVAGANLRRAAAVYEQAMDAGGFDYDVEAGVSRAQVSAEAFLQEEKLPVFCRRYARAARPPVTNWPRCSARHPARCRPAWTAARTRRQCSSRSRSAMAGRCWRAARMCARPSAGSPPPPHASAWPPPSCIRTSAWVVRSAPPACWRISVSRPRTRGRSAR
ncbi:hypothetical protein XFF7766_830012 [Xanthomonas citri pv. fuscans]|nr:hypothetical protein XFF7766_830012 [Xanthomonas citri pv. fuscans]